MPTITGTPAAESLTGSSGDDSIVGLGGNDRILTREGVDTVDAGDGNDEVNGFLVDPSTGRYSYYGYSGTKWIAGGAGDDFLYAASGNDTIDGGTGNDRLYGADGNDSLVGGDGEDTGFGGAGSDSLWGGNGHDTLSGQDGDDAVWGESGNDTLQSGAGADSLWGGEGNDWLYSRTTDMADTFDDGGNRLDGGEGQDSAFGGLGADTISGGNGNDYLSGAEGDDSVSGDAGNDTLQAGAGVDTLWGGDGHDVLYSRSTEMAESLDDGRNVMWGGAGNDSAYGGLGSDSLAGDSGNDYLSGGAGNDVIHGDDGNDTLLAGAGQDSLWGGDGNDGLFSRTNDMADALDDGANVFDGGAGNDSLYGGLGADSLWGGSGNDLINASEGHDVLWAGAGDDRLYGGNGNDTLHAGQGLQELHGGSGDDVYHIGSDSAFIYDTDGQDVAYVSADFVKVPSSVEKVVYENGARPLPYWVDALLPDLAAGLHFRSLLGNSTTLYYATPSQAPAYLSDAKDLDGFTAVSATQLARIQQAMAYVSTLVNLQFAPTNNAADPNTILLAVNRQTGSAGYSRYPDESPAGHDLFLSSGSPDNGSLADNTAGALTLIHELGHSLGLEHPFSSPDSTGLTANAPHLSGEEESTAWTVMSYDASASQFQLAFSALDIAALHYLYGPSPTTRAGNDIYTLTATQAHFIWDGGGEDTIDASALTQPLHLDLNVGRWSFVGTQAGTRITQAGQVTINFGTLIEHATGTAQADVLTGNPAANHLRALAGDDSLMGGAGNDTLDGGVGQDTAVYTGAYADYRLYWSVATESVSVSSASDGADVLRSIESIVFGDRVIQTATLREQALAGAGSHVQVMAYDWKSHALLSGLDIQLSVGSTSTQQRLDSKGITTFSGLSSSDSAQAQVQVLGHNDSEATASMAAAVDLGDAIAILKMIVGLEVNGPQQPLSPYQSLAADFDGNGEVDLQDAIGVLKFIVGLNDAPQPQWLYASESDPSIPSRQPKLSTMPEQSWMVTAGSSLNLVAYLRGDVTGSWQPPASAARLDNESPQYFSHLVSRLSLAHPEVGFSLSQWGIYP